MWETAEAIHYNLAPIIRREREPCRLAEWTTSRNRSGKNGFSMKANAPHVVASTAVDPPALAEMRITGVSIPSSEGGAGVRHRSYRAFPCRSRRNRYPRWTTNSKHIGSPKDAGRKTTAFQEVVDRGSDAWIVVNHRYCGECLQLDMPFLRMFPHCGRGSRIVGQERRSRWTSSPATTAHNGDLDHVLRFEKPDLTTFHMR